MANFRRSEAARITRVVLDEGAIGGWSDRELLESFADRGGEAGELAFSALVVRHGPMVLRTCRANLLDSHDAQDAFQATFLLLARRAGSLWVRDSIGPWLHSVACRVSAGARVAAARRRTFEKRAAGRGHGWTSEDPSHELGEALHEEVERLPERLRAPVVLCHLEGLTHDQAAEHLACPVGTVRSRLARGRDRLRRGLVRRGLAPMNSPEVSNLSVPPSLSMVVVQSVVRLAAARASVGVLTRWSILLVEGVWNPMIHNPIRCAVILGLASGTLALGLGVGRGHGQETKEQQPPASADIAGSTPEKQIARLEAERLKMEARFQALEQKLARSEKSNDATRPSDVNLSLVRNIRPSFDNSIVTEVYVHLGESVKKGDRLFAFHSTELAKAKVDLWTTYIRWDRDNKYLKAREPLAKAREIQAMVWVETQHDEKKSRLDYRVARERLTASGMSSEEINALLTRLDDQPGAKDGLDDPTRDLGAMTVLSPIDGTVTLRNVLVGNSYDRTEVLLTLSPSKP